MPLAMKIKLLLFAVLRDIVGSEEMTLELDPHSRPLDVWSLLRQRHPALANFADPPMTAVNEEYVAPDAHLREGDELAFIPPVSGG